MKSNFSKKIVAAWAMFDFAHSSFAGIMATFVFPIYFTHVVVTDGKGDGYWGIMLAISMLLVALLGPPLGAMADIIGKKKRYLAVLTAAAILGTAGMAFVTPGMVVPAMLLFILANFGYEGGTIFYDAFLPEITDRSTYGRISGYGFAAGYVGSLIILALPLLEVPPAPTFLITALFFLVFALPLFFVVPEGRKLVTAPPGVVFQQGFVRLRQTFSKIREHRSVLRFLIAFFFYNDAILTVKAFSGVYADKTLHFTLLELSLFFAMIQIIALIGSIAFGFVSDKRGPKLSITITLYLLIVVVIAAYFATTKSIFFGVGALAGVALGSSQSASRSLMARLTPAEHTAEFFGFYDGFCGKASAIIGPLVFGGLSVVLGDQRPAIVALGAFFVIGLVLLRKVDEHAHVEQHQKLELASV
jgi:UMF1 family MFS transporter